MNLPSSISSAAPDARDFIIRSMAFNEAYAQRLVADLSPQQMTHQPGPGHENHPAFTLGHLVSAADMAAQDLGLASQMPSAWHALCARRGPADRRLPEAGDYPAKEDLLAALAQQHARIATALRAAEAAQLAQPCEPWKLSQWLPTHADGLAFMLVTHAAMHLGQLAAWRRACGLPAALASA